MIEVDGLIFYFNRSENTEVENKAHEIVLLLKEKNPFPEITIRQRVFLCENYWRYAFFATRSFRSFGISHPITGNIFISMTSDDLGKVKANKPDNNSRSFNSVIVHEISHKILQNHLGFLENFALDRWKKEGFCEYMADESSFAAKSGVDLLLSYQETTNISYSYFLFRLYFSYLKDIKEYSFDEILLGDYNLEPLRQEIREYLSENYIWID